MAKEINEKAAAKETERLGLAALLSFNEFIPEIMSIFKAEYFNWKEHGTIFTVITSTYQEKQAVDQTLLIIQLTHLGLREVNGLDMSSYIKSLSNIPVNRDFVLDYFREIFKMYSCRKSFAALAKGQTYINSNLDKSLREILDSVQTIVADSLAANIDERVQITDIYGDLPSFLEERAQQKESLRLLTGFKTFDEWYGGLFLKGVYVFAAPAKVGKSTFLNYLAYQMANIKTNKVKILILDTELRTDAILSRTASALTGENQFEFLEGDFAKNPAITRKINAAMKETAHLKGIIKHTYIGNLGIDEVLSIARRWYVNEVKDGESAMIVYDYIKLAGGSSQLSDSWKEYQEIGDKTDKLDKFIASLPRAVLATSIQTNAFKEIAMSKQVLWFASNVYVLDRKNLIEIQEDGVEHGTHKLIEVVTRYQGKSAHGAHNYFKVQKQDNTVENIQNHINFDFSDFIVKEVGTNEDVYNFRSEPLRAVKSSSPDIEY